MLFADFMLLVFFAKQSCIAEFLLYLKNGVTFRHIRVVSSAGLFGLAPSTGLIRT